MPKTREKKEELVQEYIEKLGRQKSVAFANFKGITVKEADVLRKKCREGKIEYIVAKKNLLKLALKDRGLDSEQMSNLENNISVAFGVDEIGPAKIFNEYAKNFENKFVLAGGILENKIITAAQLKSLAALPTKEELLAKMLGSIKAPVSNFVNVLQGNIRGLAQVLNAIKEKKLEIGN